MFWSPATKTLCVVSMLTCSFYVCVGSLWVPRVSPTHWKAHRLGWLTVAVFPLCCPWLSGAVTYYCGGSINGPHAGSWLSLGWLIFSSVLPYGGHGTFSLALCLQPGPALFATSQSQYVKHQVGATDISLHLHLHTLSLWEFVVCVLQFYCLSCYANAN